MIQGHKYWSSNEYCFHCHTNGLQNQLDKYCYKVHILSYETYVVRHKATSTEHSIKNYLITAIII